MYTCAKADSEQTITGEMELVVEKNAGQGGIMRVRPQGSTRISGS